MQVPGTGGQTLMAAGGQDAELHLSLHRSLSPHTADAKRPPRLLWQFEATLPGSINNAVLLTPPSESAVEPRVVVSNNDCSVKFYDVPIRTQSTRPSIKEAGVLRFRVAVNHCKFPLYMIITPI